MENTVVRLTLDIDLECSYREDGYVFVKSPQALAFSFLIHKDYPDGLSKTVSHLQEHIERNTGLRLKYEH